MSKHSTREEYRRIMSVPANTWFTENDITQGDHNKILCWEQLCRFVRMKHLRVEDKARLIADEHRLQFCWKVE